MRPTKTQAIKSFLINSTHNDLARLYNQNMEVQVNVSQCDGQRIEGEYRGKNWLGWTDGITTWKSFRIPYNANTVPEYNDTEMQFDLSKYVEGIGMTGWDWASKQSRWVAYDFDSIVGHKAGLTSEELSDVIKATEEVPWITLRKSTSGNGIHLYVFLDPLVSTENHTEHAALARAILDSMSALTGFNFNTKVDVCGGNMWVYHRKMVGTPGLTMIREGETLDRVPACWRDHIGVISGKKHKSTPNFILNKQKDFDDLSNQRQNIQLDSEHKALIKWLSDNKTQWWWDSDHSCLVSHTAQLKQAFEELNFRGIFDTVSQGKDKHDHNCFCFPLRRGAWAIRRFGPGTQETANWEQDGQGWTKTIFNQEPDLPTASKYYEGVEGEKGEFVFQMAEQAIKAANKLGAEIQIHVSCINRRAILKKHKDNRLIFEIAREPHDGEHFKGWLDKKGWWSKIYNVKIQNVSNSEFDSYDDVIRHIITEDGNDVGWTIKNENGWAKEPFQHIRTALKTMYGTKEIDQVMGNEIFKPWVLLNIPFKPEYPGGRVWNYNAAQFKYAPSSSDDLQYHHWNLILDHLGSSLDLAVANNDWCKKNGIINGKDYLKCWIASLFQYPEKPLPYLFFYGPENTGKSIFHEALNLLITKGCDRADSALTNPSGFNGELEGLVLCVIEETDLSQSKNVGVLNRIKDWVTSPNISLHKKGRTPVSVKNTTHWVQCSNNPAACPTFPGDTRIVMCYVEPLKNKIPKEQLVQKLMKEAPDFLGEVLRIELPVSNDRLNLPIVETSEKKAAQRANQTPVQSFIEERCFYAPGELLEFKLFYEKFAQWLDPPTLQLEFSKKKVSMLLPMEFKTGKDIKTGITYICNMSLEEPKGASKVKYVVNARGFTELMSV